MKKIFKHVPILLFIIILSMSFLTSTAEPIDSTESPDTTPVSQSTLPPPTQTFSSVSSNTASPHWADDPDYTNADLMGNGELVESQHIVFESNLITFISVTTKSGNVFYVLVDHRIEDKTSNVYFLTKVNEYDLLSLIYDPEKASEDGGQIPTHPNQTLNQNDTETEETEKTNEEEEPKQGGGLPTMSYIILVVVIIGGIGLFIYLKMSGNKNKTKKPRYDDEDEADDYDEESFDKDELE